MFLSLVFLRWPLSLFVFFLCWWFCSAGAVSSAGVFPFALFSLLAFSPLLFFFPFAGVFALGVLLWCFFLRGIFSLVTLILAHALKIDWRARAFRGRTCVLQLLGCIKCMRRMMMIMAMKMLMKRSGRDDDEDEWWLCWLWWWRWW